jgi:hypothetical protein
MSKDDESKLDAALVFNRTRAHRMGYAVVDVASLLCGSALRRPGVKGKSFSLEPGKTLPFSSISLIHFFCTL